VVPLRLIVFRSRLTNQGPTAKSPFTTSSHGANKQNYKTLVKKKIEPIRSDSNAKFTLISRFLHDSQADSL
jgi:hypothetical protein